MVVSSAKESQSLFIIRKYWQFSVVLFFFSKKKFYFLTQIGLSSFKEIWAETCNFQQCGIFTSVDWDEPVQPPFKLRNSKWCSVSSLTLLCWSHIPHCWKSHAMSHICSVDSDQTPFHRSIVSVKSLVLRACNLSTVDDWPPASDILINKSQPARLYILMKIYKKN